MTYETKAYSVRNVTTGEVLEMRMGAPAGTLEEFSQCRKFAQSMNLQHRAGSQHVLECHDGEAQNYIVVDLKDGGREIWVSDSN